MGQKVKKVVLENAVTTTTDYLTGYQYKNTALQFFPTAEGYVNFSEPQKGSGAPGGTYNYAFNYVDHLGNVRLTYSQDPVTLNLRIMEENHYYAFGFKHSGYNSDQLMYIKDGTTTKIVPIPPLYKTSYSYKYNGKELQDELGLNVYDYGARMYDMAAPHWAQIDPKAELYYSMSPYAYCANNPVRYIDPNGMEIINGETARRERLQVQSDGYNKRLQDKYQGNTGYTRKDFGTRDEFREYKDTRDNAKDFSSELSKSKVTEAKIQKEIDDFKATDPTNFNLANNLTFKDSSGKVNNLDVTLKGGNASEFGGAVTKTSFKENDFDHSYNSISSITTTLDFAMMKSLSGVLAHEMGHAYNNAQNPVLGMKDTTIHNCQDPANRNTFQSKTAMDWQTHYNMSKAAQSVTSGITNF